jgi:hypothetical protein
MQYLMNQVGPRFAAELSQQSQEEQNSEIVMMARLIATEAAQYVDNADLVPLNLPDWLRNMVRGALIHREFSRRINALGIPGFRGEGPSYFLGRQANWGSIDSSRPDATWGPINKPHLAFELKTGAFGISGSQRLMYQLNLPKNTELIIIKPLY